MKKAINFINKLVIPLVLMVSLSIYISNYIIPTNIILSFFEIQATNIPIFTTQLFKIVGIFIIFNCIYRKAFSGKNEFSSSNIYGDYSMLVYNLAYILLGYKQISLKMKPIPLQFKILNENKFIILEDKNIEDNNYVYKTEYLNKDYDKKDEINIVLADTYSIKNNALPKCKRKYYTIKISRIGNRGIRNRSTKLVKLLVNEIQKNKGNTKIYNLFLYTSSETNKCIYDKVFHTERDKFIINVFYQNSSDNDYSFDNQYIKIKC